MPIDVQALEEFSKTPAADEILNNQTLSYRALIHNYLTLVTIYGTGKNRRGHVLLYYRNAAVGAAMVATGIISRARVYAGRQDPFYLPKRIRFIALARYGKDMDDDASHTRAAIMLT